MKKNIFNICALISFVLTCTAFTAVKGMDDENQKEESLYEYYKLEGKRYVNYGSNDKGNTYYLKRISYSKKTKSLYKGNMTENDKVHVYIQGQPEDQDWTCMSLKDVKEKYKLKKFEHRGPSWSEPEDRHIFYFEEKNPTNISAPQKISFVLMDEIKVEKKEVDEIKYNDSEKLEVKKAMGKSNLLFKYEQKPLPGKVVVKNLEKLGVEIDEFFKEKEKQEKELLENKKLEEEKTKIENLKEQEKLNNEKPELKNKLEIKDNSTTQQLNNSTTQQH